MLLMGRIGQIGLKKQESVTKQSPPQASLLWSVWVEKNELLKNAVGVRNKERTQRRGNEGQERGIQTRGQVF
jgi:hypothetical protein